MKKFLIVLVTIVFASAVLAQIDGENPTEVVISPTTGPTVDDQISKGPTEASVMQTVVLKLPQATALHLDLSEIVFDLDAYDGTKWIERAESGEAPNASNTDEGAVLDPNMACVYGKSEADQVTQLGGNFWNQKQVLPLGTSYKLTGDSWSDIVVSGGGVVVNYPPVRLKEKELLANSKNYFVCYKSFILQKFSNFNYWDLIVEHQAIDGGNIEHLYIQDNPCDTAGAGTGLYDLPLGETRHLVPRSLNAGSTGERVANNNERCGYKSWLDDLVVIAVKINGEHHGETKSKLVYTLTSSDTQFPLD